MSSRCIFPIVAQLQKPDLDKYLKESISKAFETDPASLMDMSMLRLQQHPIALTGATIQEMRKMFLSTDIPFKPAACYNFTTCCGGCGKACSVRCIQDILQKLQLMATTNKIIRMQLEDTEWITYNHVITLLNDYMKGDPHGRAHYCFEYAPLYEQTQTKTGKYRPKAVGGEWCISNWPVSGMCPFCLPKHALRQPPRSSFTTGEPSAGRGR